MQRDPKLEKSLLYKAKDSGERTILSTGSQKEIVEGRGRFDLLPLKTLGDYYIYTSAPNSIGSFIGEFLIFINQSLIEDTVDKKISELYNAIGMFSNSILSTGITNKVPDLAKLYEAGSVKYTARDWELGRPMEIFINSALRHFFQYLDGETDEDHGTAVIWNLISCADTIRRLPSMAYYLKQPTDKE